MRKGKLGQMLVGAKLITDDQLKKAIDMQKILGGKLGTIIVKLGFVSDEELTKFLAKQENLPLTDLSSIVIPKALATKIPREVLKNHQVVPVHFKDGVLTLAMSDPTDFEAIDEIQFLAGCRVEITMASRAQVGRALSELFYEEDEKPPPGTAPETPKPAAEKDVAETIEPGMEKALIPLLVEKGIITLEELRKTAQALGKEGK